MLVRPTGDSYIVFDRHGGILGRVAWLARWKQYEFLPSAGSGYSGGCCRDMAAFLDKVTRERKAPAAAGQQVLLGRPHD